ncbi:MAG: hypothetical protein ACTSWQ_08630, partial [Candidatus Thorarchaeota archaeon]
EEKGLVVMDAEHYSSKPASKVFLDYVTQMVDDYGPIVQIRGYLEEKDNPSKRRTNELLHNGNQTGVLLDTGCHILSLVAAIGGEFATVERANYGKYPGYDVETSAHAEFGISGEYFAESAQMSVDVAKFIDKYAEPKDDERKLMEFQFEDGTLVTVNFKTGEVADTNGVKWHENPLTPYSPVEYVNVLTEFHDCIMDGSQPRTSLANSIKVLDAIFQTHDKYRLEDHTDQELYA